MRRYLKEEMYLASISWRSDVCKVAAD